MKNTGCFTLSLFRIFVHKFDNNEATIIIFQLFFCVINFTFLYVKCGDITRCVGKPQKHSNSVRQLNIYIIPLKSKHNQQGLLKKFDKISNCLINKQWCKNPID